MTNTPFSQRLRVRAYECDSLGHVNNAVYLQYLQQLTLDAHGWLDGSVSPPMPRTCAVEYQTPARYGDELDLTTWIVRVEGQHCTRGYEITRAQDGANVLRAQIEWRMERVPAWTGKERALPLKPLNVRGDNGALPWRWRHVVRRYEVDVTQGVQFAAYFHWLEEATFRTAHVSRLFEVRRVRGTWIHEMRRTRDNALLLRDYSTGAFLDWQGNIRPAPPGMMERLMQGEM